MSIEEIYQRFKNSNKVCTDTRKIEKYDLFFALKGDNFNGNEYAEKAIADGANYAIIDEEAFNTSDQCILVNDVLETLQLLANHHRKTFDIPVIGLTGSNGKTTNKELLKAALSTKYKVHATLGNLNNHIGVPLTLLAMPADTEMAIIEMGANHQKEIAELCKIAEPSHGLITNIGMAHLEGFGGIEGVRKGKGELLDYLKESNGYVFVNEHDATLCSMVKERAMMQVVYHGKSNHVLALKAVSPNISWFCEASKKDYAATVSGKYNFDNIQAAYAISMFFNVDADLACEALATYAPDNNRSQMTEKGSNTIFLDAYNANPSSMAASLENFKALETEKGKVVFLGDMFELGEFSEAEHENLGKQVSQGNYETVVLYGENMKYALKHLPKAYYFTDKFSVHNWVNDKKFENKAILIKGSRGVKLETILNFI
ncbi:UDP-N-acetylmuramoyl-tripeptide--D-alanyl-D-alanine ligase [Arcticibacterium luteifluviistationis]|uniref:UDP-N-acetylmuramoyl-tripeptide--D-alanyl-D-alanine ligase n=1 Tax=Arcticibacterium luteifluviistationis TaxID=1784714 RepID=A0A2Z4GF12_9BACT|nr:UDP-N-acetylmuramoyl-tripeptide--D-alanyl-D-alanine ligase [Arcticibacterium luteifluviistationis]AWV99959.1 UDP-N-acetylmuramoyl-tripeptide--D-alanyl-D-alanine ligase [Arcticibacterium luteifluviistationis]